MHTDNRKNDILVLSEGPAHRLDDCTITAEDTVISLNPKKSFFLNLDCIAANSFVNANSVKIHQFKEA